MRQDCGSFQLVKSLYSIGNGGFGGTGLGRGTFTTTAGDAIIPQLNTDFIYSAIAQELGLIGSAGLLLVFMLFVARGMRVALVANDGFSKLLAAGLTFGFALQTFIIVGGVLRVIPLTGITLPFVSYGGSSVVANFVLLAGLLLVSNRANAQREGLPVNRQITRLALTGVGLIVSLVVATTYWQAWAAGDLADRQDNQIERVAQFTIKRGEIFGTSPRRLLARNLPEKVGGRTLYFRRYPQGRLTAHTVGYSTQSRSRAGLERSLNDYLTGSNANLSTVLDTTLDRLKGATVQGNDVVLTLNLRAQKAALDALDGRCGAVVALQAATGKALVLANNPTYDPNVFEQADNALARIARIQAPCRPVAPLYNRATKGLYAPGLDLQGRDRRRRARHRPLHARVRVRRPRLLRGVRTAREQLRHDLAVRPPEPPRGARQLRQLRLLQHRQGPGREEARRALEALRLLLDAAARDAVERARAQRAVREGRAVRPDAWTPTSTPAGSRSARSGCSSRRCRWRWSPRRSRTAAC